ncbi:MAG TPA: hypothetical protein VK698_03610 [Kofleriaceae bacterium]|nr:hypothetical protein [Kofleriaceae bacterium]
MRKIITVVALATGILACGKASNDGADKKEPEAAAPATPPPAAGDVKPATPDPAAPATDPAAAAGDPAAADVAPEAAAATDVPTTEDFEEKAATGVNKTNLEQEVSKMEKELGAKPAKAAKAPKPAPKK